METAIPELVRFIRSAERMAVITGAGCSTPSGIGDYRDANGDWKRPQPVQHHDFVTSERWRRRYWARSLLGYPEFKKARPNVAHQTLAKWETSGKVNGLITQNVDRLHQRAGHDAVIDLHGRLDEVVCLECGASVPRDDLQSRLERQNSTIVGTRFERAPDGDADFEPEDLGGIQVPSCAQCGGVLKPNVVFYGAAVPRETVTAAYEIIEQADAVLVVGSSLMVYSGFRFVRRARERNIPIAALNLGRTRADDMLAVKVAAECTSVLALIDGEMG